MAATMNTPRGVRRRSAMLAILSVTDPKVCPGPITAGGVMVKSDDEISVESSCIILRLLQFGIGILDRRKISGSRFSVQLSKQIVIALLFLQLRNAACRVVFIAEYNRFGRASSRARRYYLAVAHPP